MQSFYLHFHLSFNFVIEALLIIDPESAILSLPFRDDLGTIINCLVVSDESGGLDLSCPPQNQL